MSDVIKTCKTFLDFIYANDILPKEIIEALKTADPEKSSEWDVRLIVDILSWNDKYSNTSDGNRRAPRFVEKEVSRLVQNGAFHNMSKPTSLWLTHNLKNLDFLKDRCNCYFHDVSRESFGLIASLVKEVIKDAPDGWDKDKWLKGIDLLFNGSTKSLDTSSNGALPVMRAGVSKGKNNIRHSHTEDEREVIGKVAYCFSRYQHSSLCPALSQRAALEAAAAILGCSPDSLKVGYRDMFDSYYPESGRKGHKKELGPKLKEIKDYFDKKSREDVVAECKEILGL